MSDQSSLLSEQSPVGKSDSAYSRRRFLGVAGALAGAGMVGLSSCKKDSTTTTPTPSSGLVLSNDDVGILNYAYALEQLEAAFYARVVTDSVSAFPANELALLTEIAAHEEAHKNFFKAAITAAAPSKVLQNLTPNFATINFSSRQNVLQTARTFEDLGVAAYNGAGKLLKSAAYVALAGKIVSVEARHAALIRDLISEGTFADLKDLTDLGAVTANALDGALTPPDVISRAGVYIVERLDVSKLPTF